MSYGMSDYFKDAKKACEKFDEAKLAAQNAEDELAYQKWRTTLNNLIKLSADISKSFLIDEKKKKGLEMEKIANEVFGMDRTQFPPIVGSKSMIFAETVYLQHFIRFKMVVFNPIEKLAMKDMGIDVEIKKKTEEHAADRLQQKINDFKTKTSDKGFFSIPLSSPVPAVLAEQHKKPALS